MPTLPELHLSVAVGPLGFRRQFSRGPGANTWDLQKLGGGGGGVAPKWIPIYYGPHYRDSRKGPLIFGNSHRVGLKQLRNRHFREHVSTRCVCPGTARVLHMV